MVCCWVPFPPFSWMWSNKCWTASETNNIFLGWSSKNAPLNRTEWTGVNLKKPNLSKGTDQRELTKVAPFCLLLAAESKWRQYPFLCQFSHCLICTKRCYCSLFLLCTFLISWLCKTGRKGSVLFQIACEVMFLSSKETLYYKFIATVYMPVEEREKDVRRNIDTEVIHWRIVLGTVNDSKCSERGKLFPFPSSTCQSYATHAPMKPLWATASGIIRWRAMSPTANPLSSGICQSFLLYNRY